MAKKNKNEMSFLDHLEDLRWLLVRSSAVIVLMAIVTYAFSDFIFDDIIFGPTHTDFITYRFFCDLAQSLGVTGDICVNDLPFTIQNTSMEGQINVFIWTCITAGFILAFPYILYELWKFISPALYEKEKKGAIGFIVMSSVLFFLGVLVNQLTRYACLLRFLLFLQVLLVTALTAAHVETAHRLTAFAHVVGFE